MGQHPIFATDTQAILEKIGFFLDEEHEDIYRFLRKRDLAGEELSRQISEDLDLTRVLTRASQKWDGGYVLCGLIGNGDAFVARDPSGIRPCHYFQNEEVDRLRLRAGAAHDRVRPGPGRGAGGPARRTWS